MRYSPTTYCRYTDTLLCVEVQYGPQVFSVVQLNTELDLAMNVYNVRYRDACYLRGLEDVADGLG